MLNSRVCVAGVIGGLAVMASAQGQLLEGKDLSFLREMAADVLEESRVPAGEKAGGFGPNVTGGTVIRPGGRNCYPAFWVRDYAMSLESGLVPEAEQRHMLLLTAAHQRDTEWKLPSGSVVPPGSIADHISFDNKPIYYPGTIDDFEGQGGERWGIYPALDDHYFFVHMAHYYVKESGDPAVLKQNVAGKPLSQRLEEAYAMPPSRPSTGLVYSDLKNRGVTFGFVDSITHTGELFFCSVLKYRAAVELAELFEMLGDEARQKEYQQAAGQLKRAIDRTFGTEGGLLRASTGYSAQPDVWGTAFAIYVGALTPARERAGCQALADAYHAGTLAWQGNIRHVLTPDDFSESTAWEKALGKKNTYQNGAYWNTPTGWVAYAMAQVDREAAKQLAGEYIAELRAGDYRKGPEFHSPWECMHSDGDHRQNAVYLTSVTCPLAAFLRLDAEDRD